MKSLPSSAMWSPLVLILSLSCIASLPRAASAGPGSPAAAPPASADTLRAKGNAFLQIDGPAGARIQVDGRDIGALPLGGPLALAPGSYDIQGELRGYAPYGEEMRFDSAGETRRLQMRLIPLRRRDAVFYSVILAGLGENYVGRPLLGYVLSAAEVGGIVAGIGGELLYTNHRNDYLVQYDAYRHAVSDADVAAHRAAAQDAWNKMKNAQSLRNTGLLVAAGAVVVGMLDTWLRFPSIEVGPGPSTPAQQMGRADPVAPADPLSAHVAWNVRF